MIALSGRCLSRAWLAVALAGSDNEQHLLHWRTVRIEEFPTGVRLIALDGFMAAWCWVPAWDQLIEAEGWPAGSGTVATELDEVPDALVTVRDDELRVRDLMRHVKAVTGQKDALDFPIEIELDARISNKLQPSLLPEWEQPGVRFELSTRERVLATKVAGDWPAWRKIAHGALDGQVGAVRRVLSTHNLERVARMANVCGGGDVTMDMTDGASPSVLWQITGRPRLTHCPHGVMSIVRDTDTAGDESAVGDAVAGSGPPPTSSPPTAVQKAMRQLADLGATLTVTSAKSKVSTLTPERRARAKVAPKKSKVGGRK